MKTPDWLKPGLYGAVCGAAALAIVGFSWAGWMTKGGARQNAFERSQTDVVAALASICVDQARRDPKNTERVAALKAASSWTRGDMVVQNGWATMPGKTEADRMVANACADIVGT
ncbi:MAG: hypothetical protein J0H01_15040 [Rhizobiales bacterium]|nr:hypothetical protein [Hyphomicrobiales bacterium]